MSAAMPLERRRLGRSDIRIPVLGVGCSTFGNRARRLTEAEVFDTVETALALDADYFDVAPYYGFGLAERRLGDALREWPGDAIVSTKVGRLLVPDAEVDTTVPRNGFHSPMPFHATFDYSYDGVIRSWEASLARMGLARVNVLLVHDIGSFAHGRDHARRFEEFLGGGYRALRDLRAAGAIDAFGLGVNECAVCEQVLDEGEVDCFLLAGRYTLLEQGALDRLFPRCLETGVGIVVGGPYNTGLLAGGTRRAGEWRYDYAPAPAAVVDRVRAIEAVCDRHDVPIAAAALQFPLFHPAVACVIPGIGNAARMRSSRELIDRPIPAAFWAELRDRALIVAAAPIPA